MAQSFTTNDGITLIVPGTYVSQQVINNTSNSAQAGVVTLIGEADQGPDFTKEEDLDSNSFGPDQIQLVQSKYVSGRLVDAFREIVVAANDPAIVGAVSQIKIVKTNPSVAAAAILSRNGFGQYASLTARREGQPGNMIRYRSEISQPEIAPSTGPFTYVPHYSASPVTYGLRNNGLTRVAYSTAQLVSGPAFVAALQSLANGILPTGGHQVNPLTSLTGTNIAAAPQVGSTTILVVTLSGAFSTVPEVGDTVVIPLTGDFGAATDSVLIGGSDENRGAYIVTAVSPGVSSSTITIERINAPTGAPAVVSVAATPVSAGALDLISYKPVTVQNFTGQDRQSLVGLSGTFNFTVVSTQVTLTAPAPWAAQPVAGDSVRIPANFGTLNAGFYQVLSSTSTSVVMNRLSEGSAGTTGSQNVVTPIIQSNQPVVIQKPVIDGEGKSLESSGNIGTIAKDSTDLTPVAWANELLVSEAEYENSTTISQGQNSSSFLSGGSIIVTIGCSQETATAVVGASGIDFKVGSTTIFSALYSQFKIMTDLVTLINSQSTFRAELTSPQWANLPPSALDRGTYGISASLSTNPGRLKQDASEWLAAVNGSGLVEPESLQTSPSGLPEQLVPDQFLTGGSKAGTTSAQFLAAIDACQGVNTNFITPLISQDASQDILQGLTESSSTYTVDAVNAYCNAHVIAMSALKARRNRIAVVSKEGTYAAQKAAAQSLASFRTAMTFQDVKAVSSDGTIQQYQPWMGAVVAVGMQAAAGFKGIVKKFANISGIVKPQGDFSPSNTSQLEDALKAGLLILERVPTGGFRWVSDQMTYSVDNNFVYNSLQAVYLADLMSLSLIQAFDLAVVGKSVAEISAAAALSFLDGQMYNFLRLKWIAPSDDAPKGYKNAVVNINGGVMQISLEVKLAGLIYFVPITFAISQVQQTASA